MKTNLSHLFFLFDAASLFHSSHHSEAQSLPDIIYENASNNTLLFRSEYSNSAFCEYDVCHSVLEPGAKQWVAFSQNNGNEIITYDVCAITEENPIIYQSGKPECFLYSGANLNVTSMINEITAVGNNYIQYSDVNKMKENQTDSDACLDVYKIHFFLKQPLSTTLLGLPEKNLANRTSVILSPAFLVLAASALLLLLFTLFKHRTFHSSKDEPLLPHRIENAHKKLGGFFTRLPFYAQEEKPNFVADWHATDSGLPSQTTLRFNVP